MNRIEVRTASASYPAIVGPGLLRRAGDLLPALPGAERAFVVASPAVSDLYLEPFAGGMSLPCVHLSIPDGEQAKSLVTVEALYQQLAMQEAHRDDAIVALGGGATGDVAGFVAATYMRGVPFVQIPTTLTAQVDAAIGGKVGINLPRGKNLVGAFHQPRAVLADVDALATVPDREFRSGLAEVVKYGLAVDPAIVVLVERSVPEVLARDAAVLTDVVTRCVRAKAAVVGEDERDTGRRHILNYGHTLGHALERLDAYAGLTHGEAVATGMVFAAHLAELIGHAGPGLVGRHRRVLAALGLPHGGEQPDTDAVLEALRLDKKYRGGSRFVLLEDVGRAAVVEGIGDDMVREALGRLAGVGG